MQTHWPSREVTGGSLWLILSLVWITIAILAIGIGSWYGFAVNGPAALYHHLLGVDMEGFDPGAPAPETAYKGVMEEAASSGPEAWVKELWDHPDTVLPSNRALMDKQRARYPILRRGLKRGTRRSQGIQ